MAWVRTRRPCPSLWEVTVIVIEEVARVAGRAIAITIACLPIYLQYSISSISSISGSLISSHIFSYLLIVCHRLG
jgi:hypothetical protein